MLNHRWHWQFNRFDARSSRFSLFKPSYPFSHPFASFTFRSFRLLSSLPPSSSRDCGTVFLAFGIFTSRLAVAQTMFATNNFGTAGVWTLDPWSGNLICWPLDHATPHELVKERYWIKKIVFLFHRINLVRPRAS